MNMNKIHGINCLFMLSYFSFCTLTIIITNLEFIGIWHIVNLLTFYYHLFRLCVYYNKQPASEVKTKYLFISWRSFCSLVWNCYFFSYLSPSVHALPRTEDDSMEKCYMCDDFLKKERRKKADDCDVEKMTMAWVSLELNCAS